MLSKRTLRKIKILMSLHKRRIFSKKHDLFKRHYLEWQLRPLKTRELSVPPSKPPELLNSLADLLVALSASLRPETLQLEASIGIEAT